VTNSLALDHEYRGTPAPAIEEHYDIGTEFYKLWLDDKMITYSGALWGEGDTLVEAQERKLDYFIDGTGAGDARRLLDIGCGWGGLARRLVDVYDVEEVVALTLSRKQHEWISDWEHPRIDVRLEGWADHLADEPYDAIISIGALEHFAQYGMNREEKVEAYRDFFQYCRRALPPGGRLGVQTIAKGNAHPTRQSLEDVRFLYSQIFTHTDIPWFSEVLQGCERLFDVRDVRNDGDHYVKTCEAWHERYMGNRDRADELVGEELAARYEHYMEACTRHFRDGHITLLRFILERV
jgi:cyclopropane-fatty-acyl-phospholipid synthase